MNIALMEVITIWNIRINSGRVVHQLRYFDPSARVTNGITNCGRWLNWRDFRLTISKSNCKKCQESTY